MFQLKKQFAISVGEPNLSESNFIRNCFLYHVHLQIHLAEKQNHEGIFSCFIVTAKQRRKLLYNIVELMRFLQCASLNYRLKRGKNMQTFLNISFVVNKLKNCDIKTHQDEDPLPG